MSGEAVYGVYSVVSKKFVFGIAEPTKRMAWSRLYEKIGKDAYKWRWQVRKVDGDERRKGKANGNDET